MRKAWITALAIGLGCIMVFCLGGDFLFEAAFYLVCGWALFLSRVVPEMSVDPSGVPIALASLLLLAVGLHLFLRWLYAKVREARPSADGVSPRWRMRWTGTILALVVLMFAAGTSAVGITHQTAWLFRSPGPIVRMGGGGREMAARINSAGTDGTSNTILAGEAWAAYKPWGHPRSWRDPAAGIRTTPDTFGSPMRSDQAQFLMADGSVRTVNRKVGLDVLKALATPDGGEDLPRDW
jgi:hypothetical protein